MDEVWMSLLTDCCVDGANCMDPVYWGTPHSVGGEWLPWFDQPTLTQVCGEHGIDGSFCNDPNDPACCTAMCGNCAPVLRPSVDSDECFTLVTAADYRGSTNQTSSGTACVGWHEAGGAHPFTPGNFTSAGIGSHNYCRVPFYVPGGSLGEAGFYIPEDIQSGGVASPGLRKMESPAPWCFTTEGTFGTCAGCLNSCIWEGDGTCDDGGINSDFADCPIGTDCKDCGVRSSPGGALVGVNEAQRANCDGKTCGVGCDGDDADGDGVCEDGGVGSKFQSCGRGSDCVDCGPRAVAGPWSSVVTSRRAPTPSRYIPLTRS